MRYPVDYFTTRWYSAQKFEEPTTYGFHDGEDINLKTGGSTDLGQPLYAMADGVVTSVEKITTGFGHNLHIKYEGPWGVIWSHYAHCQNISVSVGDVVKEGQKVAEVGYTGNSRTATGAPAPHCHWAMKKAPSGIGNVANSLEELHKYWVAPIEFVEKWKTAPASAPTPDKIYTEAEMTVVRLERDKNYNLYQEAQTNAQKYKTEFDQFKQTMAQRLEVLAKNLGTPIDWDLVLNSSARFDGLSNELHRFEDLYEREVQARKADVLKHQDELEALSKEVDQMRLDHAKDMDMMQKKIDLAISQAYVAEQALKAHTKFGGNFWKAIGALLRKET